MINSENVLNSRQLEQEIETFVHGFLKEKRDIHSSKVMWQVSDEQMERVENMEIPAEGREASGVIQEMTEQVYQYRGDANHPRFFGFVPE